ncbi:hypothetical protein BO78DRAFT_422652 [Aspergillus sclerotiicarbonarius CBS 121057]|uniref:Zn(2)-C6 fungal-type domain-containing protein n=1 Tax=Aspergillus sclerotiicarbonarius (strain CBS 121057 / IBT 28362) TaxID=1448318 RepID=A0A319ENE9_ASPSB|nr:hypothetical protein BO78DRAFT_422652 [Aspergillus sclerotiicarbonarius CBS 121057]
MDPQSIIPSFTEKRVPLACSACQKGKRKCDGVQPACSLCSRLGKECQYSERPPRRKRMFIDKEYVRSLERENEELKKKIDAMMAEMGKESAGSEGVDRSNDDGGQRAVDAAIGGDARGEGSNLGAQSAIDEITSMTWRLNIGMEGEPSFGGPSGGVCFPGVTIDAPFARGRGLSKARSHTGSRCNVIDAYVEEQFIESFMRHVAPYYGFLDPRVLREMGNLCNDEDIQFYRQAACIAGSCYSQVPDAQAIGDQLADMAKKAALMQCGSRPRELTVLALSVLAWRELSLGHENMGWMYISMAGALAIHLGLHVLFLAVSTDNHRVAETLTRKPISIKIFWSFFLVERMATTDLGRHCNVPWGRIGSPVYSGLLGENSMIEDIAFAYQCELWHLHDTHMDQIYAFAFNDNDSSRKAKLLKNAHEALTSFYDRIDTRLHLPQTNNPIPRCVLYFHMSYHNSSLLIHRPFLRVSQDDIDAKLVSRSVREAADALSRLIRLHQKLIGDFKQAPPFLIQHVLSAGIIFLSLATTGRESAGRKPVNGLRDCFLALEEMQCTWELKARRAIEVLRQIAYRWEVVWALPMRLSHSLGAAPQPTVEAMTGDSEI